ncbi:MAG: glycosyltransferase family 4 protein [Candidatus Aminicenantes bacterium]|nr:glycosyltransferase family 4 protein [Candidatus Aminicenantes bacterium]
MNVRNKISGKIALRRTSIKKPRIAIIVDQVYFVDDNGNYFTRANLRRELLDGFSRYFDVTVFGRVRKIKKANSEFSGVINSPTIKFINLPNWELKNLIIKIPQIFYKIFVHLRGFDIVILRMMYLSAILAFPLCVIRRIPFIIQLIGDPEGISELQTKLGSGRLGSIVSRFIRKTGLILLKTMTSRAAYCTAVSSMLAQKYFENEIAISDTRLEKIPSETKRCRHNNEKFTVLYVGRLVQMKNPNILIEAISLITDRVKGLDVVFVGEGPLHNTLENQVKALNLQAIIKFTGFISEPAMLYQIYSDADVLVLPSSQGEGLPLVIIEAMAHGLPVVATDVGGIREIVLHGQTGYLLSKPDPIEIAYYLEMLAKDGELCFKLSKSAKELAKNYTVDAQVKKMQQIVDLILEERSSTR